MSNVYILCLPNLLHFSIISVISACLYMYPSCFQLLAIIQRRQYTFDYTFLSFWHCLFSKSWKTVNYTDSNALFFSMYIEIVCVLHDLVAISSWYWEVGAVLLKNKSCRELSQDLICRGRFNWGQDGLVIWETFAIAPRLQVQPPWQLMCLSATHDHE